MKYTFHYFSQYVPSQVKGLFGSVTYVPICTGGAFIADDPEQTLQLTDYDVFYRNRDWIDISNNSLWFEGKTKKKQEGYLGKWTEDIDKNAKLYYINIDGITHKFYVIKPQGLTFINLLGVQYIIEFNGNQMDAIPEEGDILYSSEKEAKNALKQHSKKNDKS